MSHSKIPSLRSLIIRIGSVGARLKAMGQMDRMRQSVMAMAKVMAEGRVA